MEMTASSGDALAVFDPGTVPARRWVVRYAFGHFGSRAQTQPDTACAHA